MRSGEKPILQIVKGSEARSGSKRRSSKVCHEIEIDVVYATGALRDAARIRRKDNSRI